MTRHTSESLYTTTQADEPDLKLQIVKLFDAVVSRKLGLLAACVSHRRNDSC